MYARRRLQTLFVFIFSLLLVWGGLLGAAGVARGQAPYEILHSFNGSDGSFPIAGLIMDSAGTLYGTTYSGGALESGTGRGDGGTVFKLDTSGKFTLLQSLSGSSFAGVIRDSAGNLYGTTVGYGFDRDRPPIVGTLFKLGASGVFTTLHVFDGSNAFNGVHPLGGVIMDGAGTLYGTTAPESGWGNDGYLYKVDASRRFTDLGGPGGSSQSGVIRDSAGTLYGTTINGGFGAGSLYKRDVSGAFTILHKFTGYSREGVPYSGVIRDSAGTLYGTTVGAGEEFGAGSVYKLDVNGTFTTLHEFNGSSDGSGPEAGVIRDSAGTLYGTTYWGGAFECGTVYRLDTSGRFTTLYDFNCTDGAHPRSGVIRDSAGNLYGTAVQGGANGKGVVYRLNIAPPSTETIWFEAEPEPPASSPSLDYSNVTTPILVREDAKASEGRYIVLQQGVNNVAAMPAAATPGIAKYRVFTKSGGNYRLYARVIAPSQNNDSFWIRVDGGTPIRWNNIALGDSWHWDFVHDDVNVKTPTTLALAPGFHGIEIAGREEGTRLDVLALTNDPIFNPMTQTSTNADPAWLRAEATNGTALLSWTKALAATTYKIWASNSDTAPYSWTLFATTPDHKLTVPPAKHYGVSAEGPGRTTTGPGPVIDVPTVPYYSNVSEAEFMGLTQPFALTVDPIGIWVRGLNSLNVAPATGWARLDFRLPKAATAVKIWGQVVITDYTWTHDSFWVRVDGGRWIKWNNLKPQCSYIPIYDTDAMGATVTFNLAAGTHSVEFAYRESDAILNRVFISDSPTASPPAPSCTN